MGLLGSVILVGALSPAESILTAQHIVQHLYIIEREDMLEANRPWILSFLLWPLSLATQ